MEKEYAIGIDLCGTSVKFLLDVAKLFSYDTSIISNDRKSSESCSA